MRALSRVFLVLMLAARALAAQAPSPLSVFLTTTGMYDSNIEHDATDQHVYGGAVGLGLGFERSGRLHAVEARYEVAGHRYSNTDRWNRISQHFEGAYTLRPARWVRLQAGVEVTLKGNSEDRDLGNQYAFKPRLEFRPSALTAIRLTAASRLKQDDSDREKDADNTYLALELRQRHLTGVEMTLGVRREWNRSRGLKDRYSRTLYRLELSRPVTGGDLLAFSIALRAQGYRFREVDLGGVRFPRRDNRITTGLGYTRRFGASVEVTLGYEFEARGSNDPEKEYSAHLMSFAVTRRW